MCDKPLRAHQLHDGRVVFSNPSKFKRSLLIPCGQCVSCRLERSRQWAMRCTHEASLHEHNSFITLTYSPVNLPAFGSLNYRHFQLFMKRLRKYFKVPIRFYMCGEYGDNFSRPHYHAILFGLNFDDRKLYSKSGSGFYIYTSEILNSLWGLGNCYVGDFSFESAAYVARYVMKKITGDAADFHYAVVDPDSGEILGYRVPEFTVMSRKPGIGRGWLDKFYSDVFPHNRVIIRGVKMKPPSYYMRVLRRSDSLLFDTIKSKNLLAFNKNIMDNTPSRRRAKSIVTSARVSLLKRDSF